MKEYIGNIFNDKSGVRYLLEVLGWKIIDCKYINLNVNGGFLGNIFKNTVYQVILSNNNIQIHIIHHDKYNKIGTEWMYKIVTDNGETNWTDINDFNYDNLISIKRDIAINNLIS